MPGRAGFAPIPLPCRPAPLLPRQLPERLAELCADGSPGCVKAAVKALVVVSGPEGAAKAAADLAGRLLERLKVWATAECVPGAGSRSGQLEFKLVWHAPVL